MNKKAFSLIELILSIIVVAIISLSVPVVIRQVATANAKSLAQESILNAKTFIGFILRAPYSCQDIGGVTPFFYKNGFYGAGLDFYTKMGLAGTERRTLMPVANKNDLSQPCLATSRRQSIDNFNNAEPVVDIGLDRDYVVSSTYKTTIKAGDIGDVKLNQVFPLLDNFNDIKVVNVAVEVYGANSNLSTKANLVGFAANTGDNGPLGEKPW
jgi:prokaryotic N-methylation motif domain protein